MGVSQAEKWWSLGTGLWSYALGALWAIAFVAGAVGIAQRISTGHRLADYGSYMTWGLWVAVYQYLIELAAGAFLLAAAIYLLRLRPLERLARIALLASIAALLAGTLTVWLDLGRMERFWQAYSIPSFSSVITWMVLAYTAFLVTAVTALWFATRRQLVEWAENGEGWQRRVGSTLTFGFTDISEAALRRDMLAVMALVMLGTVLAITFSGGEGALFGVVGARPYWNSAVFPIAFLASAIVIAGAVLTVFTSLFWPERGSHEHRQVLIFLGWVTITALVAFLLLEFAAYSVGVYASIPAQHDAYQEILTGTYWWSFWLIHLVAGAAVPLAIFALRGASPAWLGTAAFLVGAGMLSVRLNAVIPGQILPQLEGLDTAFADSRMTFEYFPSLMEWLVALFVGSIAILLFYTGYQILPIASRAPEVERGPIGPQPEVSPAAGS